MSDTKEQTPRERAAAGDRPMTLSQVAKVLRMKKPNVARYLARHNIPYAFEKGVGGAGYMWWESDILAAKARREADQARMSSDEKRRAAAIRRRDKLRNPQVEPPSAAERLGPAQRKVMLELLRHPIKSPQGAQRHALRRVRELGYAESMVDVTGDTLYVLTDEGRRVAAEVRL